MMIMMIMMMIAAYAKRKWLFQEEKTPLGYCLYDSESTPKNFPTIVSDKFDMCAWMKVLETHSDQK